MSASTGLNELAEIEDELVQFYKRYCTEEIEENADKFPSEKRSVYVEYKDLFRFNRDIAEDWLEEPDQMQEVANSALLKYPGPIDFGDADGGFDVQVRLIDTNSYIERKGVGEIRKGDVGEYVAVSGQLSAVTAVRDKIVEAAFECQRCGTMSYIPQPDSGFQEPHECSGCERQGPFSVDNDRSRFIDSRKAQIQQPPEDAQGGQGDTIDGNVQRDLVNVGGQNGLADRAGDRVVVFGVVHREQISHGQEKTRLFEKYMDVKAVHFENTDLEEIDPKEHIDEIREHAQSDDVLERFAESIVPAHYTTPQWDIAFRLLTAYLFAAPRLDRREGPTFRGDIHVLLMGDPSTGKSQALSAVSDISPDSERRSATGLASNVGLTAAATKDDFGGEQFTLKPGILPRAGWHAIIDEIDKGPDDLTKINDALEGDQVVTIDKAGIKAKLNSRTGLLASGNPKHGRFQPQDPLKDQIDIDPSLFSRFDGIVILTDEQDEDLDSAIADQIGESYSEAMEMELAEQNGNADEVEQDATARQVDLEILKAWVKHAREQFMPRVPREVTEAIDEFYVDVRSEFSSEDGPATTTRTYEACLRFAVAFARMRLSDVVEQQDVEHAIQLSRDLIGQTHDSETGTFDADVFTEAESSSQKKKYREFLNVIDDIAAEYDKGAPYAEVFTALEELGKKNIDDTLETLRTKGLIYEQATDHYRTTEGE